MVANNVAIVMATYNGAAYVKEQVESIKQQTFVDWKLFVRDDGSSDATLDLLESLAETDSRIIILKDDFGAQKSAKLNFAILAQEVFKRGFCYLFFADQDDIWVENKLATMIARMQQFEIDSPGDVPTIVYSDLIVVDEGNTALSESFLHFQGIQHEEVSVLNVLLAQNFVTGCASMVNRSLLKLALPFPNEMIMHDWWLALCAATSGRIIFIQEPLVRYRQHESNSVGAKGFWSLWNPFDQNLFLRWTKGKNAFINTVEQAKALRLRLKNLDGMNSIQISSVQQKVDAYADILKLPPFARLFSLKKHGIKRQNMLTNIALKLRVFFM